jgi:hypothetical protein
MERLSLRLRPVPRLSQKVVRPFGYGAYRSERNEYGPMQPPPLTFTTTHSLSDPTHPLSTLRFTSTQIHGNHD